MVWPFGRRKQATEERKASGPQAPRDADADRAVLVDIEAWLGKNAPGAARRTLEGQAELHLGKPSRPGDPAGAVLKVKRGKLAWVDLYDPALRATVNDLVKHLDRQQKWSFNGVIATKYAET